jgi:Predicted periplasmic protein
MKKSIISIIVIILILTVFAYSFWGPYTNEELQKSATFQRNISTINFSTEYLYTEKELEQSSIFNIRNKEPAYLNEYLTRTYTWEYSGQTFTTTIQVPKGHYDYYRNESHTRNYNTYVFTVYDQQILASMIEGFKQQGDQYGYSKDQTAMNVIAFVQSLPYTSDNVTTGYDEYPRYPIETLIDGGGDCEDTSILAAALLTELGYGTILISPPNHMALGIMGSENISGTYWEYDGSRYYYVETTGTGWGLGVLPSLYDGKTAKLYPISRKPAINVNLEEEPRFLGSDLFFTYYKLRYYVENSGPSVANNVSIYLVAEAEPLNGTKLWKPSHTIDIGQMHIDSSMGEAILRVPHGEFTKFTVRASGDYFGKIEKSTDIFKVSNPELNANMTLTKLNRIDFNYDYYKVRCNIENKGTAPARYVYANITAETAPFDKTFIWAPAHNIPITIITQNESGWVEAIVKVPRGETAKITCEIYENSTEAVKISSYV